MSNGDCRRWLVSGRVQGVFFRESTRREALQLGLRGHAVNLPDGRVEVIACGAPTALKELEAWLWEGPRLARVEQVQGVVCDEQSFEGFQTG